MASVRILQHQMPRIRIRCTSMRQPSAEVVQVSHREDGVTHSPDQQGRDVRECVESRSDCLKEPLRSGGRVRSEYLPQNHRSRVGPEPWDTELETHAQSRHRLRDSGCRPNKALCPAGHHSTDTRQARCGDDPRNAPDAPAGTAVFVRTTPATQKRRVLFSMTFSPSRARRGLPSRGRERRPVREHPGCPQLLTGLEHVDRVGGFRRFSRRNPYRPDRGR